MAAALQGLGRVAHSRACKKPSASSRLAPHIVADGRKLTHTAGLSGFPKRAQRRSGSSCTQGRPAGLPCGMPGIGEEIEGAMQQAPQWERQSMVILVQPPTSGLPARSSKGHFRVTFAQPT